MIPLSNPYYIIGSVNQSPTRNAKFAMWTVYKWALSQTNASIVDTKLGSVWTDPSTLTNNDWLVIRWTSPSMLGGLPFDLWVQATDASDLNVSPTGQRGLFVRMGYHTSGVAWNGTGGAYGTPYFKAGSYVFPVADQMAPCGSMASTTASRLHVVGDDNWLVVAMDSQGAAKEYDAGFIAGLYGVSVSENTPPLMLVAGTMNRSQPGHPLDNDATCCWRMSAQTIAAGSEVDTTGNGNDGTPAGSILLNDRTEPDQHISTAHEWTGATPVIHVAPSTSWQLGATGEGFTHSWWVYLKSGTIRNLMAMSGIHAVNNGPLIAWVDNTENYLRVTQFGSWWSSTSLVTGNIQDAWTQVTLVVEPSGGAARLYTNGVQVDSTSRIGNPTYQAGRNLTIGALARVVDQNTVTDPFAGTIADYAIYNTAKSPEWVSRAYSRSIGFVDTFRTPLDHGGALAWSGSSYEVVQLEIISSPPVLSGAWQPNYAFDHASYDSVQMLIKTVLDSVGTGYMVGGILPLRASYGRNNRLRAYTEPQMVMSGIDTVEESISLVGDGQPPGPLG